MGFPARAAYEKCNNAPSFDLSTTLLPKDQMEGAGMGLTIARKTARTHGGDLILADNARIGGATFRRTVPAVDPA